MELFHWLIVLIWVVSGLLAYGNMFAYLQRNWPNLAKLDYWSDVKCCTFVGLAGPIGLLFIILNPKYQKFGVLFK